MLKTPRPMKATPNIIALFLLLATSAYLPGHSIPDNGVTALDDVRRPHERTLIQIPEIDPYVVLKCDLHMHTVFSDGLVWPTIRVQEAWEEGLDAIAISDHIEYQPHRKDIPTNHNRSYEIAKEAAADANLLLVKGSELTRTTPPGHFNAIFIEDASGFVPIREDNNLELDAEAISKAVEQNAFIFWNHPGWKVNSIEGSYEWIPFLEQLLEEGQVHGIEVINGFSFHRKALDWALDKGLTVMGSSDIHNLIAHEYDMQKGASRSMTLVFAKERSLKGLREGLEAGRTVAWSTKLLAGNEEWIRKLYDASVTVNPSHSIDRRGKAVVEVINNSDFHFELQRVDPELTAWPDTITLNPQTSRMIKVDPDEGVTSARYAITNAFIRSDQNLVVEIELKPAT
jgi:predicted metal-dependent phosphoesterase TrpH